MRTAKRNVGNVLEKPKEIRNYKGNSALLLPATLIGVEVEMEGLVEIPRENENSYWQHHADNSLRNQGDLRSTEFVLKFPLCGEDLILALKEFDSVVKAMTLPPIMSERTSVHIHLDVRDITEEELYKLILLYTVFERPLFKFCGNGRDNNPFCLPFYKAEGGIFEYIGDIEDDGLGRFSRVLGADYRYAAFNLCSLLKFGSVEFRHCAGTYDIQYILLWINIIMSLKKYAVESNFNIATFPVYISDRKYSGVMSEVFGEFAASLLYEGIEKDILSGIRQAQKIMYSVKSIKNNNPFQQLLWPKSASGNPPEGSTLGVYVRRKWPETYKKGSVAAEKIKVSPYQSVGFTVSEPHFSMFTSDSTIELHPMPIRRDEPTDDEEEQQTEETEAAIARSRELLENFRRLRDIEQREARDGSQAIRTGQGPRNPSGGR